MTMSGDRNLRAGTTTGIPGRAARDSVRTPV